MSLILRLLFSFVIFYFSQKGFQSLAQSPSCDVTASLPPTYSTQAIDGAYSSSAYGGGSCFYYFKAPNQLIWIQAQQLCGTAAAANGALGRLAVITNSAVQSVVASLLPASASAWIGMCNNDFNNNGCTWSLTSAGWNGPQYNITLNMLKSSLNGVKMPSAFCSSNAFSYCMQICNSTTWNMIYTNQSSGSTGLVCEIYNWTLTTTSTSTSTSTTATSTSTASSASATTSTTPSTSATTSTASSTSATTSTIPSTSKSTSTTPSTSTSTPTTTSISASSTSTSTLSSSTDGIMCGVMQCSANTVCSNTTGLPTCICMLGFFGPQCDQVDCIITPWGQWSQCSETCSDATAIQTRYRTGPNCSQIDPQNSIQTQSCTGLSQCDPLSSPVLKTTAVVLQSFGCTILIVSVSITLGLFLFLREFGLERCLHMWQELPLVAAHILILLYREPNGDEIFCIVVAQLLQYLFLVHFAFLCLESVQSYSVMANVSSTSGLFSLAWNSVIGWVLPAFISGGQFIFLWSQMPSQFSCWLNFGSPISAGNIVPIGILACLTVILNESASMHSKDRLPLTDPKKLLAVQISHKWLLIIVALSLASWLIGATTIYYRQIGMYATVFALNSALGICISIAHVTSNERVYKVVQKFCKSSKR